MKLFYLHFRGHIRLALSENSASGIHTILSFVRKLKGTGNNSSKDLRCRKINTVYQETNSENELKR